MSAELKYGLITGTSVCLGLGLEYWLGFHTTRLAVSESSACISILILLFTLWLLLRHMQADTTAGRLGLVPAVAAGLQSSLVAALVVCSFLLVYSQFINPEWIDTTLDWKVAQLRAAGVAETVIRREIVLFRRANSPAGLVATTVLGMTLMGAVFSFGLALLLRGRASPPPGAG